MTSARGMTCLAAAFARGTHPRVVALAGELGSGKTTFVRGFLRAKGVRGRIVSPSFLIFRRYPLRQSSSEASPLRRGRYAAAYHVDLYRLRSPRELRAADFSTILRDPHNLMLIEWAERARRIIPRGALWILLRHGGNPRERFAQVRRK